MMDKKELNDLLIVRFLSGQSSPEESREVIEWLNADHKNRKLYFHLKRVWQEEASKELVEEHISNSWNRIRLRI